MPTLAPHTFIADLGPLVAELEFHSLEIMTFTVVDGSGLVPAGYAETVPITTREIRPGVWFTSWIEQSGVTVTHLEDLETGTLLSNATLPDGSFHRMVGTIRRTVRTK